MNATLRALATLALSALLLAACASEPEPRATADIEPKVRVVSTAGEGTEVTVVLFRGSLPFATYRLQAGERLTASTPDGTTVELERGVDMSSWLRRNAYVGSLPETRPGDDVVIALTRAGAESAPDTVVRVPGEIRVTRPGAGDERTLNDSFSVAWEPLASGEVELRFRVEACEGLDSEAFDDLRTERGFAQLPLSDGSTGLATLTFSAPDETERCEADVLVGRVGDAIALDAAFGELRDSSRAVRVSAPLPLVFGEAPAVATADIEPKVRVVSTAGESTEVTVVLFRPGVFGSTYELALGERLTVTPAGGESVVLRPGVDTSSPAQPDAYVASLPALGPGAELVIALERVGEVDAPNTVVRVPEEIELSEPEPDAVLTLGEAFTLAWSPFDPGQVELRYAVASCTGLDAEAFDDLRTDRAYPQALLEGDEGTSDSLSFAAAEAERCEVDLLAGRVADAIEVDPAFRGLRGASRAVRVSAPLPLVFEAAP